jgi:hypothetical protein
LYQFAALSHKNSAMHTKFRKKMGETNLLQQGKKIKAKQAAYVPEEVRRVPFPSPILRVQRVL